MNEIEIKFSIQSPQKKNTSIDIIMVSNEEDKNLLYKFNVGLMGVWTTLREFDKDSSVTWKPEEEGEYHILVQAKREDGNKAFNYLSRATYIIGENTENIIKATDINKYVMGEKARNMIKAIDINKDDFKVGDKLDVNVITYKDYGLLYKYYMKSNGNWEVIKDYSTENTLSATLNEAGENEVLVEVKENSSLNQFDYSKKIKFNVRDIKQLEIDAFNCLTETDMVVNREIVFQVDVSSEDTRMILYKFLKIDSNGNVKSIQDYSTKRIVSFVERVPGKYRLLCMAKDMYSKNEYDDRAIVFYNIKKYRNIKIKKLTTDLVSPQYSGRDIVIKTLAEGGNRLLYRFIIESDETEDSGYISESSFVWKTKKEGIYKITVMIKDESFNEAEFEVKDTFEYVIDKEMIVPLKIKNLLCNKDRDYLEGETVTVEVEAEGGVDPVYSFIVYDEYKKMVCEIPYSDVAKVDFTPKIEGEYELQVRARDKYSIKEYDCNSSVFFKVRSFIPANIDYILRDLKEYYRVNEEINLEIVAENGSDVYINYKLYINNHFVEETEYIRGKKYIITPKCSGKYKVEIFAKNIKSTNEYDCKKELELFVHDAIPVTDTKVKCNITNVYINESISFAVDCNGGKDVCYEFYLMERGEWKRIQKYSKKNFYSFIPFCEGQYKVLALTKSSYKNVAYEDYDICSFTAEVKK